MSKTYRYLEHCIAAVASIDADRLAACSFDRHTPVGEGSTFSFYGLGALSVSGERQFVGLKLSNVPQQHDTDSRFLADCRTALRLTERVSEFMSVLPRFMGLVAIAGDALPAAIITEDASENGTHQPREQPFGDDGYALLAKGFAEQGALDEIFSRFIIDRHINHRVNGTDRWLDLNASPFGLSYQQYKHADGPKMNRLLDARLDDLTVTISSGSPLAESLRAYGF